jgi:hypothetical protein
MSGWIAPANDVSIPGRIGAADRIMTGLPPPPETSSDEALMSGALTLMHPWTSTSWSRFATD